MASGKVWNRRLALAGGAALAAGGATWTLYRPRHSRAQVAGEGVFRRGNVAEPETLDPILSSGVQEFEIISDLMVGLMTHAPDARPVPGMATHWETSADGLTWTFHLRQAQWSDGAPVTAEDFVFSWRRLLDPAVASTYSYFLDVVKNAQAINGGKLPATALGARALDPRTLEVQLVHPAPYLLEMLTHTATMPLPAHVVAVKGRQWARPENYVGNGPFVLKQWIPNEYILVEKNPRFYDAANVALEQVYYYPTADYGEALQRFRAGELDFQDRFPVQQIDWVKKNIPQTIDLVPQLVTDIIAFNFKKKPFDDIRVREAINLALNREAIGDRIMRGFPPAYAVVPPGIDNYPHDAALAFRAMPYAQRMARAKDLMRAAGYNENHRLKSTYLIRAVTAGVYRAVAAAVQQMLAQVFIDISILPDDMQVFYPAIQAHDFEIAQSGWVADFNDASNFLDLYRTGSGNNWGEYSNPAFDTMMDSAQADVNLESRGRKLAAAEAMVLKDFAAAPLFYWVNLNITWPYVKGFKANAQDYHRSRWVSIDQAARAKQFA
ncbi:MAG TPA: peptide ABC transporter substrate-binding protein [Rhizomicrobium sp.]|nr:peptide ABC transporter substrate-binding protein [Rhizomicrobium sp.]